MVLSFFKNDNELLDIAKDLVKRREYSKAINNLEKAIDKDKDGDITPLCKAMIAILTLHDQRSNINAHTNASAALRNLGTDTFELGLTTFVVEDLALECDLTAEFIRVRSVSGEKEYAKSNGDALIECARKFQAQMWNKNMQLVEFFDGVTRDGAKYALLLMAEANESYSVAEAWLDPKKAAEYQQLAMNYRKQMGETGEENQRKIESYSKSATCWICGRESTGEGMHFFPMSSDISPQAREKKDILPAADEGYQSIYVCRACYTAVSRKSDEISRQYYDASIRELRAAEARLEAQIRYLEARVNNLSFNR